MCVMKSAVKNMEQCVVFSLCGLCRIDQSTALFLIIISPDHICVDTNMLSTSLNKLFKCV